MRLIDADKFKVYLQEYLHYGHAIPWVDAQPTAYNVDKVVEELEETLQDLNVLEILSHFDPDSTIQTNLNRFLEANKNELLRIVRKGGVEHG